MSLIRGEIAISLRRDSDVEGTPRELEPMRVRILGPAGASWERQCAHRCPVDWYVRNTNLSGQSASD